MHCARAGLEPASIYIRQVPVIQRVASAKYRNVRCLGVCGRLCNVLRGYYSRFDSFIILTIFVRGMNWKLFIYSQFFP